MAKIRRPETRNLPNKQASLFFIGCDGAQTEFQYFQILSEHFHSSRVKIKPIVPPKNQTGPLKTLDALKNLLKLSNIQEEDEAWLVLDVDHNLSGTHKQNLIQCLTLAKQNKPEIKITMSHPTFEVWLIMHHDNPSLSAGTLSNQYEQKCRQHFPGYKKNMVDRIPVINKFRQATDYAKTHRHGNMDWPDDPGSDLFKLIESLLSRI